MPRSLRSPEELLPLTPAVFYILLALAEGGGGHGYAIMTTVGTTTGGLIKLGPGTLYGTIKRLLGAGLIQKCDERPDAELDDERRRYYGLTRFGRRVLQAEVQRYSSLVKAARACGISRDHDHSMTGAWQSMKAGMLRRQRSARIKLIASHGTHA